MERTPVMEARALLDKINEQTSPQEMRQIVERCKSILAKEPEPVKLWRSPLAWKWVIGLLITLLALTMAKFWSNLNWIAYTRPEPAKPGTPVTYDIANLIIYGIWIVGPPLIFLYEYTSIFGKEEKNRLDPLQIADLKYCHELAGKIWAGVGVCLGLILLVRYGIKL